MANTPQDDRFYNPNKLLKVFGISSIVMLVFTIWMILDDYGREWKGYQKDFFLLKKKKYQEWIDQAKQSADQNKLNELTQAVATSEKNIEGRRKDLDKAEKELSQVQTKEKIAVSRYQGEKSKWDVEKYQFESNYGHKVAEGEEESHDAKAQKSKGELDKHWLKVLELRNAANTLTQAVEDKQKEVDGFFAEKTKLEKELKVARGDLDKLISGKKASELTLNKLIRSAPILDLAAPVFKLQQIVVDNIRTDIYFAKVQTVDRCTSCHMAIDTPGFEKEANPFKTHPKLDLMLGSKSPHPIDKIGCTVCHQGRGQASEFVRVAHTPQNEEQKKVWEKKYGWHEMHHVIEKMIPLQYTEGQCRVCHHQTEFVPRGEKVNASVQLVKAAGCYGCHKIEGWDHLRKPAPSLKRIKGKLTRDWIVKWVRNPQTFNDHARMPAPFHQSNITTTEFKEYQEAEIHAITDYLLHLSDSYEPNHKFIAGNRERGKALVGSVGCLGCHQINDFGQSRGRFVQAPDLSTVGSKVSGNWLISWIKNPKHYWDETVMPSLRLSDSEAADIATYLLSKKNSEFEQLSAGSPNLEIQKKVLRLYLTRDPKLAPVTDAKVDHAIASLKAHEVSLELGRNAVTRYGCFGCHTIKGYEKTAGIGTELTEEGSKPVNKLDFGLLHLEHTNVAWFDKKLENTRLYDKGAVKEYLDLLRMPNYGFDGPDRQTLITWLLGMTSQKIDPPAAKVLTARESKIEDGIRVVHKYNCQGCHIVEQLYQPLPDDHPMRDEHEKEKYRLEGRILAHYSEDETLGPPPLVTEGKRVQTAWAHSFIHDPSSKLRTRLKVRMPTFQMPNEEINKIVTYFANHGEIDFPIVPEQRVVLSATEAATAKALFNKLQCLSCHTAGGGPVSSEDGSRGLAPDLLLAHKRLNKEWIMELLKDPQKMIPGTRMPGFWPDGNSPAPDVLNGNSDAQRELLARYVIHLGQSR